MKKELYFCDICKEEKSISNINNKKIQVIFTTEQTEGRSCEPYLSFENVDICRDCENRILNGSALYARGAQGYNTFDFKD